MMNTIALVVLLTGDLNMSYDYSPNKNNFDVRYEEEGSSFDTPPSRPEGLGSSMKVPKSRPSTLIDGNLTELNPEMQLSEIDVSLEIYKRYKQIKDANKKLMDSEGALKFSSLPPSRDTAKKDLKIMNESNIKESSSRAKRYKEDLKKEFPNLSTKQISAMVANLHHESQGFTQFYEQGVKIGGEGDAQWTADRRKEFRAFIEANDLNPRSYEASRDFFIYELKNNKIHGFTNWDKFDNFNDPSKSVSELTRLIERRYFVAGKPMMDKRIKLANNYYKEFSAESREER